MKKIIDLGTPTGRVAGRNEIGDNLLGGVKESTLSVSAGRRLKGINACRVNMGNKRVKQ